MGEALISIIIPVYNVEDYLADCIKSVVAQTYENLEIILVDDGSTDKSSKICDEWSKREERIKVIHSVNCGVAHARNIGLDVATGDYIGFVDSDDMIESDMYECLYKEIVEKECDMSVCAYRLADRRGNDIPQKTKPVVNGVIDAAQYLELMYKNARHYCTMVVVWNKLFRRALFNDVRFRENVVHEDDFLINDLIAIVKRIAIVDKEKYIYVQNRESIMHVQFTEKRLSHYYALRERLEFHKKLEVNEEWTSAAARECLNTGVRFWLLVCFDNLLSKDKEKEFYNEVAMVIREYNRYGTIKQNILWNMFLYTPTLLKTDYIIYKSTKQKLQKIR